MIQDSDSAGPSVQVDARLLQQILKMAQASGGVTDPAVQQALADLPGMARFAPTIDVCQPLNNLALEVGKLLSRSRSARGEWVFLRGDAVVTLEDESGAEPGRVRPLTAGRLVGHLEQFAAFKAKAVQRVRQGLSRDDTSLLLETDAFRAQLRPLNAVHLVRMPVLRAKGRVELLQRGYDVETGIFTLDTVPYEADWDLERSVDWMMDVCWEFPWNGLENETEKDRRLAVLRGNRSFAVHVLAVLGAYCRGIFPDPTLRPMFGYFANKPGSGKTRLAEMALAHVYGYVAGMTVPKDEDKLDVKLETLARTRKQWVIFDDIGGQLRSNALNKFLTEMMHEGRCMGANEKVFSEPNVTQVFVTANELPTSEDLGRRALVAELFLDTEVRGRKFERTITGKWLASPEVRAAFLSACWGIVRNWATLRPEGEPLPMHTRPLESFEEFSGYLGAMVQLAGFADPLQQPDMDVGGATQENEMEAVLKLVAASHEEDVVVSRGEIVTMARDHGLIEHIVGAKDDAPMDAAANKRFGRQMQRWRGQKLRTAAGRRFQFGYKKVKAGSTYPLVFLQG